MMSGEQSLKDLLLGAFEGRRTGLGVVGRLSPLFMEKGLHGRLLAEVLSHLPALHAQLASRSPLEAHRLEEIPATDLTEHEWRTLLAYYYRQTIRMLESERWPEEVVRVPDRVFFKHLRTMRDRELVEMAATMVELETGSPSAHKVTPEEAGWEHMIEAMSRLSAARQIAFGGSGQQGEPRDVISRVRMAFILTLVREEAQSQAANTLLGLLQQIQGLGQCGINGRLLARMWLLPSGIAHEKLEREGDECQKHVDFTSLLAIVSRWRDLVQSSYPPEVVAQLCAGNWHSALVLLKGHPHLFLDLKRRIVEMVRLQMPFGETVNAQAGQERIRLPFEMEVIFRAGPLAEQMAVGTEILTQLGSRANYPLRFFWQDPGGTNRSLELVDARPELALVNGTDQDRPVEMILLRVFCLAWGIGDQPTAVDFGEAGRLLEAIPRGVEVDAGVVAEIREVLNLHEMSTALSRVENVLDQVILHLPAEAAEGVKKNVQGLRRLIRKAGAKKKEVGQSTEAT